MDVPFLAVFYTVGSSVRARLEGLFTSFDCDFRTSLQRKLSRSDVHSTQAPRQSALSTLALLPIGNQPGFHEFTRGHSWDERFERLP